MIDMSQNKVAVTNTESGTLKGCWKLWPEPIVTDTDNTNMTFYIEVMFECELLWMWNLLAVETYGGL
jgi:hypothetical protein